jgi:hypothetical protein
MKHIIKGIVGASALFTIGFGIVECLGGQDSFWQLMESGIGLYALTIVGLGVAILSLIGETERSAR